MQAVAFASRQHAALLLLIRTGKIETAKIGTCIYVAPSKTDCLIAATHNFINRLVGIDSRVRLVHISNLHSFSNTECSFVGLLDAHYHLKKSGFTGTIGTNNSNNTVAGEHKVEILKKDPVAICFANTM